MMIFPRGFGRTVNMTFEIWKSLYVEKGPVHFICHEDYPIERLKQELYVIFKMSIVTEPIHRKVGGNAIFESDGFEEVLTGYTPISEVFHGYRIYWSDWDKRLDMLRDKIHDRIIDKFVPGRAHARELMDRSLLLDEPGCWPAFPSLSDSFFFDKWGNKIFWPHWG